MIKNLIIGAIAIGFLAWILESCQNKKSVAGEREKPLVVVSIPPQLFFIHAIAGDRVNALSLLKGNADPETFEPTMAQLVDLEKSDAFMPVGTLPFETELVKRLLSNNKKLNVEPISEGIELIKGTHSHEGKHNHGGADSHADYDDDPHIWSSPKNAKIIALNTLNTLIKVDGANEDVYRSNYQRLKNRLDSIDESFGKVFNDSSERKVFIVWHPSLSYFARDYSLEQVALSAEGKETSVKGLIDKINKLSLSNAAVCFYQKEFDSSHMGTLTDELGVKKVEISPLNEEWEDEMQKLYDAFTVD